MFIEKPLCFDTITRNCEYQNTKQALGLQSVHAIKCDSIGHSE